MLLSHKPSVFFLFLKIFDCKNGLMLQIFKLYVQKLFVVFYNWLAGKKTRMTQVIESMMTRWFS
jgi:hypothetical protein